MFIQILQFVQKVIILRALYDSLQTRLTISLNFSLINYLSITFFKSYQLRLNIYDDKNILIKLTRQE